MKRDTENISMECQEEISSTKGVEVRGVNRVRCNMDNT